MPNFIPGQAVPSRRRFTERPLPPYSYVPGHAPHPVTDPAGHMFGEQHAQPPPLDPESWQSCEDYLWGIDLFNHGYYWEAHEAWEGLWHTAGRAGRTADFLKGLIKLAAAAVKAREGNPRGVVRHARRAQELFETASDDRPAFAGLCWQALNAISGDLIRQSDKYDSPQPNLLLNHELEPGSN